MWSVLASLAGLDRISDSQPTPLLYFLPVCICQRLKFRGGLEQTSVSNLVSMPRSLLPINFGISAIWNAGELSYRQVM